jgi:hypothetical protein
MILVYVEQKKKERVKKKEIRRNERRRERGRVKKKRGKRVRRTLCICYRIPAAQRAERRARCCQK